MTPNVAEKNILAGEFAARYADATLTILSGATVLAVHTLAGFGAVSSGAVTSLAIPNATNVGAGVADNAILNDGAAEYVLTVAVTGTVGVDVKVDDLTYLLGGTSSISTLTTTY